MNRKIKFRAWDKKHKEWLGADAWFVRSSDSVLVIWPEVKKGAEVEVHMETLDSNRVTVSQYTGLKDKNWREIYDGDIIEDEDGDIGVVEYQAPEFWVKPITGDTCAALTWPDHIEIIGNHFEHPELLEQPS